MKKLLGMFLCLGLCLTLGFGTTGCTKKDEKDKTVKDKGEKDKGEKDKAVKDKGDKDKGTKDKGDAPPKVEIPVAPKDKAPTVDPIPDPPKDKKADPIPDAPKDKKADPIPEPPKDKKVDPIPEPPKDKAPVDKDKLKVKGPDLSTPPSVDPKKAVDPAPAKDKADPNLLLPKIDPAPTKGVFLETTPLRLRRLELVPVLNLRNSLVG